jgi:uncharacterized protein (TIGR02453 family)
MGIDSSILEFLNNLSQNNNKPWFEANKSVYQGCLEVYNVFLKEVHDSLKKTDEVDDLKRFRIYRDIRFSKDKTPYKNNFGTGFVRSTSKLRGGYYLHIQPHNCFAGGGFWDPNPQDIKRIRDEFSYDPDSILAIQSDRNFVKYFGSIQGDGLKNVPKGYDPDLKSGSLIKKKQWVVMRSFSDKEVVHKSFTNEVIKTFEAMRPFFNYMSTTLTTDSNGESIL